MVAKKLIKLYALQESKYNVNDLSKAVICVIWHIMGLELGRGIQFRTALVGAK